MMMLSVVKLHSGEYPARIPLLDRFVWLDDIDSQSVIRYGGSPPVTAVVSTDSDAAGRRGPPGGVGGRHGGCGCGGALCAGRGRCVWADSLHPGQGGGFTRERGAWLPLDGLLCGDAGDSRPGGPGVPPWCIEGASRHGRPAPSPPATGCPVRCQRGCPVGAWRRADGEKGCAGALKTALFLTNCLAAPAATLFRPLWERERFG